MVCSSAKEHKGGRALQVEPSYHEVFEAFLKIGKRFVEAGWLNFCKKNEIISCSDSYGFRREFQWVLGPGWRTHIVSFRKLNCTGI